jgi:hypothetical protein
MVALSLLVIIAACGEKDPIPPSVLAKLPSVVTAEFDNIKSSTCESGGNVYDSGGDSITTKGICWSLTDNPTIADYKTMDGTGAIPFLSNMSGLTPGTKYYVKAYATNSVGTGYGTTKSFYTYMIDVDGNEYTVIAIRNQIWLGQDLKAKNYNNNISIKNVTTNADWKNLTTDAYCCYDNNAAFKDTFGLLYNW